MIAHPGKIDIDQLRAAIERAEQEHGWQPSTWYETTPDRLGNVIAREALDTDPRPDLVIAAGGDGTVRAVAEALEGSDTPLAIVPAGTGNLLARNLALDVTDVEAAVEVAFGGLDRWIDVGHATVERPDRSREEFVFAVLAGIGVDAGMIANTPSELKSKVGWVAYVAGIYRTIISGAHFNARVRVDGGSAHSVRAQSIMVGNCGLMPGGVLLLPDAQVDDGLLDVCILRPRGLFGWLQVWGRMVWHTITVRHGGSAGRQLQGAARPIRALRYEQGRSVVFRISSGSEEFEIDGEALGEVVAAHITVNEGTLLVKVPDDADGSLLEQAIGFGERQRKRIRQRVLDRTHELASNIRDAAAKAGAGRAPSG